MKNANFEYYMVYGSLERLPLAVVHKKNVKDEAEAKSVATEILAKRGASNIELVEMSEKPIFSKPKGSEVNFCYYEESFIDIKMVNDNQPAIMIHADKDGKGVGFTFMDEKVLEDFVRKVNDMYLIHKGRLQ